MTTGAIGKSEAGRAAALPGAADWVCLAAAPVFAVMALSTGVVGGLSQHSLCSATRDASGINGMVWMYLLMSAFHIAPWLKLFSAAR